MMAQQKVLIVGRSGQVASALAQASWPAHLRPDARGRGALDLLDAAAVADAVPRGGYAAVVNAAAYTDVDRAEQEPEAAWALNRDGPAVLASACAKAGIPLVHISSDYVFDGRKSGAWREDDPVNSLGVYGASKAAGEEAVRARLEAHVILRTAWVFSATGRNFLRTMLRLGGERNVLRVVDDQHGGPTAADDIARAVVHIVAALTAGPRDGDTSDIYGTFHYCGAPAVTWHGFARAIFAAAARRGAPVPEVVEAIPTSAYPTPAKRPMNSVLDCRRIRQVYGLDQPAWEPAMERCVALLSDGHMRAGVGGS